MPQFVALLRGINVGGNKRVPMAELRDLLLGLGYTGVGTLLNSGNAVFAAPRGTPAQHADKIAAAIVEHFKFEVPVIVKSAKEWTAIVEQMPLAVETADHSRLLVAFVQDASRLAKLAEVEALVVPPERYALGQGAAYLLCASGILESKAGEALLSKAGQATTTRNWATVLKLQARLDET